MVILCQIELPGHAKLTGHPGKLLAKDGAYFNQKGLFSQTLVLSCWGPSAMHLEGALHVSQWETTCDAP
jgi:hypothetical protein